ncbi:unnamed protein product [Closterium sp. NIES-53]
MATCHHGHSRPAVARQAFRCLLLLGASLACRSLPSALAVRLHETDAESLEVLAYLWGNFAGSDTWSWRHVDCRAMDGIKCDDDGYVIAIILSNKNIGDSIPEEISLLQHLRFLSLEGCQLTDTIPNALFDIPSLKLLDLTGNSITGTLPTGLSRSTSLESIYLRYNQLSGSMDPLCNLSHLKHIDLSSNFFNHSLPDECSKLTLLTHMQIDGNQISGSIPASFGQMSSLEVLNLSYNLLTGTIPDSFRLMQSLTSLKLASNQLSGSIPNSIGGMTSLVQLYFRQNLLTGSIPASLTSLQHLGSLLLDYNHLTGSIPAALADLPLYYLSTASNPTSGSIPTSFGKLTNMLAIDLSSNQLHGTIPRTLSNLSKIRALSLAFNQLSGPVDHILQGMRNLSLLFLLQNHFSGGLPRPAPSSLVQYWRPAAGCSAFCGVEVGVARPVCGGHGYCAVNPFVGAGECVCDPNYMRNSSDSLACVPGAVGASLASDSAYVSLQGSAAVLSNGSILLTGGAPNQQGAAFASPALRLFYFPNKRSLCGIELAFTAAFSFAMRPAGQAAGGEGLAFVVAAAASGMGASVGLGGVGKRSVAVEFDSVLSVKHSDPNNNHVGVNVGGSPVSLASATAPLILNDAHTKHAWIHYDPTSGGTLRVFLSSDLQQPFAPALTASVSLCSVLKPTSSDSLFLFGFIALSGSQPQRHTIVSWTFNTDV